MTTDNRGRLRDDGRWMGPTPDDHGPVCDREGLLLICVVGVAVVSFGLGMAVAAAMMWR